MTVRQAIERIDSIVRNTYTNEEKVFWLSNLDAQIATFILKTIPPYKEQYEQNMDSGLLAEPPFDMMYIHWLEAQIAYANGEIERYSNAISVYQQEYDSYANYVARNTTPETVTTIKYF
ncbi:MAG: hypothetical protein MSS60_04945 [Clostridiales bacterium]|nr:hypothetical protein [Clostridiales bacterium]